MSFKIKFNTFSKSFLENKISNKKKSFPKNTSQKHYYEFYKNNLSPFYLYSITYKNLKKYSTSNRKYNIYIINSIIFDQRIHKVAVFKNYLLWDESSEFLKRFYKNNESTQRIPKISEYYVRYTLFPPVYYGFDGLVVIIMNKWTKRKKNYLEFIEEHEDEKEERKNKNKNISFEKIINSSLINNKESSKSILSKNTLELTKFENESNKKYLKDNFIKNNNNNFNTLNKDNSLSFSNIIDDLSSHYSVIFDSSKIKNNNINDSIIIRNKDKEKKKKINNRINLNNKNIKNEGRNETNFNKIKTNYYYNSKALTSKSNLNSINMTKSRNKSIESPKKSIKICLNKKNIKYMLNNNNTNILKRNNNNLPSENKKFQKKILKTDNNIKNKEITSKGIFYKKGTIRVNTITNYFTDKNKILNSNIIQRNNKSDNKSIGDEIISSIKHKINHNKNGDIKKNLKFNNNKKYLGINNVNALNYTERNSTNKINNISKQKIFIDIKRKSFIDNHYSSNKFSTQNQLTYRNTTNQIYYLYERPNEKNLKKSNLMNKEKNKCITIENMKEKEIKNIHKNNNKLFLEDPFTYKLTQLTKKKKVSLTSTNSLSKINNIKNFKHYCTSSILENKNNNDSNNNNSNALKLIKINYKKNLVLTKLNSIKNMESKILGNDIINNSTSLHKNNDNSLNINFKNKMSNSSSYKPKKFNSKNINLNLNLNIQFNIDIDNKNKAKKNLPHNTIINQIKNRNNKNIKNTGETQNKDNNYQFPLTSKNSKRFFKDLINSNKIKNNQF